MAYRSNLKFFSRLKHETEAGNRAVKNNIMSNLLKSKFFLGMMVVAFALVASTASAAYMHTGLLKMGMTSSNVMSLQQTLNGGGFLVATTGAGSPGMESMYFGAKTKAAVMAFQSAKGLTADGVVGTQTGTALASMTGGSVSYPAGCTSTTGFSTTTGMSCASTGSTTLPAGCMSTSGFSPTTGMSCSGGSTPSTSGPLMGGAGDITVSDLSTYSSEEVGEGEEDVMVLAFEVEADDESDVEITSVKVEMFQGTAADSEDLTDYADNVSVWMGSTKVGEEDADGFSENSDVYTKSISLDNAVVKAGATNKFYVAVSAMSNLDSGDIDTDAWYVGVSAVRFVDAEGVTTTESLTLDIDDEVIDDTLEETFDFTDFATATDVELKVALNNDDDDINESHVINVDATDDTDDVEVLSFTLEADGDSDINVTEIPVLVTTTGEVDEAVIVIEAKLWMDGEELATEDVPTGGAVTFQDLDIDINAGDEVELMVTVSLQDINGVLDDGDTVKVELTNTEVDAIDAEDESGESLGAADLTGTAAGEAHATYDVGINAKFVSASAVITNSDTATIPDRGTFTIVFDVTAFDGDVYVDGTAITDEAGGATYQDVVVDNGVGTGVVTSNADNAANTTFLVEEGTTERFTVTLDAAGTDAFARGALESILYALTPIDGDVVYSFNMGDYETDSIFLESN